MNKKRGDKGWFSCLLDYASGSKGKLLGSVILSVISIVSGIVPYYCLYKVIDSFIVGTVSNGIIMKQCAIALVAYLIKVVLFGFSTGLSHYAAYHILEKLRLKVAERFLHASLGEVTSHSIGEIKNIMMDKIEDIEPPFGTHDSRGFGTYHAACSEFSGAAYSRLADSAGVACYRPVFFDLYDFDL